MSHAHLAMGPFGPLATMAQEWLRSKVDKIRNIFADLVHCHKAWIKGSIYKDPNREVRAEVYNLFSRQLAVFVPDFWAAGRSKRKESVSTELCVERK